MAEPVPMDGFVCSAGTAGACPLLKQKSAELEEMRARFREAAADHVMTSLDLQEHLIDDASRTKKKKKPKNPTAKALADLGKKKDAEREHALLQQRTDFKEFFKQELAEQKEGFMTIITGLHEEIEGLKVRVTGLEKENAGLKEENTGLKVEISSLKEESIGLKAEISSLKEENIGLKARVTDLEKENVDLKGRVGFLEERERQLAMRSIVHILNQLMYKDDRSSFFWAAHRHDDPLYHTVPRGLVGLLDKDLREAFSDISSRGSAIAHDEISKAIVTKVIAASNGTDKLIAENLLEAMEKLKYDTFKSVVKSGTP